MELNEGWELAASPAGACVSPSDTGELEWRPARVPGTAAAAIGADGRDFDAEDWWFRVRFAVAPPAADQRLLLELDGIATVSEVFLNGEKLLDSFSMWKTHALDVTKSVAAQNELAIACRALRPLLRQRRRPAPRWRTRMVDDGNLRWYRTMIFGRSPGFAPGPAPVGPWRPVRLCHRGAGSIDRLRVRTRLEDNEGIVLVRVAGGSEHREVTAAIGPQSARLRPSRDGFLEAELRLPSVARWWPHTHGEPTLHDLSIMAGAELLARRRIGFRALTCASETDVDGLDLHVNGERIFARGAVWTPPDLVSLSPSEAELRTLLGRVRDAGMNMLRIAGTGAYESSRFHDLCDELGILVWQDLMFANLDYPLADSAFSEEAAREARDVIERLAWRPSLAVVCGNSEVEQQPAMMGLDPALGRDPLWDEVVPQLLAESEADCAYVRSTPSGGDLPFHADRGVSHYFGVSGYMHPPADARRAGVRFAAECLAFANVPDDVEVPVHHPRWKEGVARDAGTGWDLGAGWDFDDVRDFYLELLFELDSVQLRRSDHDRYLELSRTTSGEVMAEVLSDWRREESPCRGALILWLKDMLPGAGLGVIDHAGKPKVAYYHLRRALQPVAVWTTDEGVNGVRVYVANERPQRLDARLRVALYRDQEVRVAESSEPLNLPPHASVSYGLEAIIGRFVDAAWAYRFGPPQQDAIVASLESRKDGSLLSQSFRFPGGHPIARQSNSRLQLTATAALQGDSTVAVTITTGRLACGVRVTAPGYEPDDDAFCIEPGGERKIRLQPGPATASFSGGSVSALNLDGRVKLEGPL